MSDPAGYVRAAFAAGYASAGPWAWPNPDLPVAFEAAAATVAGMYDDPRLVEATIHLGRLEGVHKAVFNRRLHLLDVATNHLAGVWAKVAARVDVAGLVRQVRVRAGLVEAAEPAPEPSITPSDAATLAATFLADLPGDDDWDTLAADLSDGLRRAYAEGQATSVALSAGMSIDFDTMVDDVLNALAEHPDWADADPWLTRTLGGTATDLGRKLSGMLADGDSYEAMVDGASRLLTVDAKALRYVVDFALGQAMSLGARDLYARENVAQVAFVTAGDSRVDDMCEEAEARGPYNLSDAPIPPLHGFCRCALVAQDWADSGLQTLLDSYSEG